MIDKLKIRKQAETYLNGTYTMKEVADIFNVSKKTVQDNMKRLKDIDPDLYGKVQDKKQESLRKGTVKGGQNSKPNINGSKPHKKSIDDEAIKKFAKNMLDNNLTYRDLEELTGIPKSTLKDNFTKERLGEELYKNIKDLTDYNKANTNKGLK